MSLPGRFLSRRCFTLCITMEEELRSSITATTVVVAKQYRGKGMQSGKKVSLRVWFFFWEGGGGG